MRRAPQVRHTRLDACCVAESKAAHVREAVLEAERPEAALRQVAGQNSQAEAEVQAAIDFLAVVH